MVVVSTVRRGAVYGNTRRTEWCEVEEKRGGRDRKAEKEMERERERVRIERRGRGVKWLEAAAAAAGTPRPEVQALTRPDKLSGPS